jgi:hypothetical protein
MNPCTHTKWDFQGSDRPEDWAKTFPLPGEPVDSYVISCSFSGSALELPTPDGDPSYAALNEFLWDSVVKCSTQVPEDVSIANFLWEIKEEIVKILENLWQYLARWLNPGGANLGWHFALKQFLQDLKKIKNILKSARARLKFLRDSYGKPTTYRFRSKGEVESFEIMDPPLRPFDDTPLGPCFVYPYLWSRKTDLHCTFLTVHTFPGLNAAMALLDVIGAKLGLQNPLKVIWNAIPFSWLLDYFVSTGSFFDRLQLPTFSGEFTTLASCHGWKVTEQYKCWMWDLTFDILSHQPVYTARNAGLLTVTYYVRRSGIPLGSIFTLQEGLSEHQQGIILSLLGLKIQTQWEDEWAKHERRRRRKRRRRSR